MKNSSNFKENFKKWLVGFTDGDGSFSILKTEKSWNLCYKISQSTYNIKLIYFIKNYLKVGHVTIEKEKNMISFRIRDKNIIENVIIPIFDKYPLLTSKILDYKVFKQASEILNDLTLNQEEKDKKIIQIKEGLKKSKEILIKNNSKDKFNDKILNIPNEWLVGFWESEGSFFIVKNGDLYQHSIGIVQKLDKIILNSIRDKFKIKNVVQYRQKHNYYKLETKNLRVLENVIKFFDKNLLGVKALELKIWKKTIKFRKDSEKMLKAQNLLQKIRTLDKNPGSIYNWVKFKKKDII